MRQHLQIDAGLVHLAQPQRAEIVEPLDFATRPEPQAELLDLGVLVMFFECYNVGLLCHCVLPSLCSAGAGDPAAAVISMQGAGIAAARGNPETPSSTIYCLDAQEPTDAG
jgi:hypothetical protein